MIDIHADHLEIVKAFRALKVPANIACHSGTSQMMQNRYGATALRWLPWGTPPELAAQLIAEAKSLQKPAGRKQVHLQPARSKP